MLPLIVALGIIHGITTGLLYIPIGIFNWIINDSISIINQPVVVLGWGIARDLVNIGLVLALIIIGLATILRIKQYAAGQMLKNLIIVAILVNFTPVICGFFIDIANVVMHVFEKEVFNWAQLFVKNNASISWVLDINFTDPIKAVENAFRALVDTNAQLGLAGRLIAGILFNILNFFVLLGYALIFLIRIMVLWALVILSPFAALGLALPYFKKAWNGWWKNFIQWTFIGIPLFFFLYLAEKMIESPVCKAVKPTGDTMAAWTSGSAFCGLLSLIFPTFFLLIGLGLSLKTGTEADKILDWGEKKVKGWGKSAGMASARAVRDNPTVTKTEGAIRRRMETIPVIGNAFGGPGAYERDSIARTKAAGKGFTDMSTENLRKRLNVSLNPRERASIVNVLGERKDLGKDGGDEERIKEASLYAVDAKKLTENIYKNNPALAKTADEAAKITANTKLKLFRDMLDNPKFFEANGAPITPGGPNIYTDQQKAIVYQIISEGAGKDSKLSAVGEEGESTRKDFYEMVKENEKKIFDRIKALKTSRDPKDIAEKKRLVLAMRKINTDLNFKF